MRDKIKTMMADDHFFDDPATRPALADALVWITKVVPGRIIMTFLLDIGLPPTKGTRGYRKSTSIMDEATMHEHLEPLRSLTFDAKFWDRKGYMLKGLIRMNGCLLQLLAFKLKELQSVRFRRVAEEKMPNLLTMTIGGTNQFLTEARNVFQSPHDVEQLLTSNLDQITVLLLDLGTSCLVGAMVSLPPGHTPATL